MLEKIQQSCSEGGDAVVLGLAEAQSAELCRALSRQGKAAAAAPFVSVEDCIALVESRKPGIVFCATGPTNWLSFLRSAKKTFPGLPVVVVSRCPEVSEWLDALEAGAHDYCTPPFESRQIRWIVEGALRPSRRTA